MEIRVRKINENAVLPAKAHETDAGFDLVATSKEYDQNGNVVYGTGLAFEIPDGHVGLLFPRSSNSKKDLYLTNSVGVLDSGYRGEVMFKYKSPIQVINPLVLWWNVFVLRKRNAKNRVYVANFKEYEIGDRIGQLIVIPYPKVEFVESEDLSNSERGDGGYGSTGR